ncbi:phage tail protein [Salinigranum sp. GCM10025319]|uniref:phage tail protein n=1 Tax=Salinigranum sp. GCM10025319 TaxID=3252687 RepID=UPI003611EAB8
MSARTDPYRNYRFAVEIDSLVVGGFSEVSGLERELQVEEYNEGGVDGFTHAFPDRMTSPNLVLKRGLTDSEVFWEWLQQVARGVVERKSGRVIVLNSVGEEVRGWAFREAYPVKWTGPELRADQGAVAFETVELTHRGLSKLDGLG